MNDQPAEPTAPLDYKGHQILLTSRQEADGTWVCEYLINELGKPQKEFSKGHPDGSSPSREAAELAAVQKAKALIDLR
ncbi:MAG: hypothetical protein OJF51_002423 [Nitrospira sp.]|jgi:hypothetical protein|nr:MAG: hypothetical protein OJF51_002423 [Nitrospira sp.]